MKHLSVKAQAASSIHGLGALFSAAGAVSAVTVLLASLPTLLGKDPFLQLGPAADERERASRKQIAPAVAMYAALRTRLGKDRALEIMRRVIDAGTLAFLAHTVGEPPIAAYLKGNTDERRRLVEGLMAPFFNAVSEIREIGEKGFTVEVTACHFPGLCQAAGVAELAPLFCAGDLEYFNRPGSPVKLERDGTLAEGRACCPFSFSAVD